MTTRQRLRRAGKDERGRGCFGRRSSTPHQLPPAKERDLAVTDDSPLGASKESPSPLYTEFIDLIDDTSPGLKDSASWEDGAFLVRLQVDRAQDTGVRRRWLEMLIYSDSWSPVATEGPESSGMNPDEGYSAGVREPLPKPLAPLGGTASASVETKGAVLV